jgi:outer membrane lipoprotein SlyB
MKTPTTAVLALAAALALPLGSALAATAKAEANPEVKAAQARYESDKKLCNDETTSSARLQCRRDAKVEYDQAVAAAKAKAATPASPAPAAATNAPGAPATSTAAGDAACPDCGRVMAVSVTQRAGDASAVGVIAGGAIGAVLGNQVGGGFGKDLATLAGAAGGAYAGKVIEEKMKTHTVWTVTVHYPNDSKSAYEFATDPGFQVGDWVRNSGNTIVRK